MRKGRKLMKKRPRLAQFFKVIWAVAAVGTFDSAVVYFSVE